ncbi:hypothetical protein NMG60_11012666 [Bertholletia excelsa]
MSVRPEIGNFIFKLPVDADGHGSGGKIVSIFQLLAKGTSFKSCYTREILKKVSGRRDLERLDVVKFGGLHGLATPLAVQSLMNSAESSWNSNLTENEACLMQEGCRLRSGIPSLPAIRKKGLAAVPKKFCFTKFLKSQFEFKDIGTTREVSNKTETMESILRCSDKDVLVEKSKMVPQAAAFTTGGSHTHPSGDGGQGSDGQGGGGGSGGGGGCGGGGSGDRGYSGSGSGGSMNIVKLCWWWLYRVWRCQSGFQSDQNHEAPGFMEFAITAMAIPLFDLTMLTYSLAAVMSALGAEISAFLTMLLALTALGIGAAGVIAAAILYCLWEWYKFLSDRDTDADNAADCL